jgi:hypothetical protein
MEKWNINNNNSNNYVTINNICRNYRKQCKYQKLAFEIKKQWKLNMIIVTPLVSSAMEVNPNMLNQSPTKLLFTAMPGALCPEVHTRHLFHHEKLPQ